MLSCAAWWWILLEMAFQPVRRYMILFVTKNKRHHSTEGRRNLSKDTMCRAYHGKVHLWVCPRLHKSQHLKGWKICLLYEFLFKLGRIKHIYIFFFIHCLLPGHSSGDPERTLHRLSLSPSLSAHPSVPSLVQNNKSHPKGH